MRGYKTRDRALLNPSVRVPPPSGRKLDREGHVRDGSEPRTHIVFSGETSIRKPNSDQQFVVIVNDLSVFEPPADDCLGGTAIGHVVKTHYFDAATRCSAPYANRAGWSGVRERDTRSGSMSARR